MLELLLGLSVVVNRVVEAAKKTIYTLDWIPADWKPLVVLVIQLFSGVAVVAFSGQGVNFFPEGYVDKGIETVIVGFIVGFGAEAIHIFVDVAKRLRFEKEE